MKKLKLVSAIGILAILLSSCTMQKRLYTHGYYIESNVDINNPLKSEQARNADKIESAPKKNEGSTDAFVASQKSIGVISIMKNETGKTKKQISPTLVSSNAV